MSATTRCFRPRPALAPAAVLLIAATAASMATAGTDSRPALTPAAGENTQLDAPFDLADFGRTLYDQRCQNCHAISPGTASLAPPLHDVIGRQAGSAAGYSYSQKLDGSNLVWTAEALDDWLRISTIATPDIRFRHVGIKDAIERKAVLAYVLTANRR